MDPCDVKSEFISLFLFENGVPCQPERLRVRRTEIDKYFQKNGKTYCYQGKTIYSCCGESVCKFSSDLPENAAFVLVPSHEKFIQVDYETAFEKLLKKMECNRRKLEDQRRTRSAASVCAGEEDHCGSRKSKRSSSDHQNLSKIRTLSEHCESDFEPEPCESECKPKPRPSCDSVTSCKPKAPPPPSRGSKPRSNCDFKPKRSSCDSGPSCDSVSSCQPKPRLGFESKSKMSCDSKPKRSNCDTKPSRSTCEASRPPSCESARSSCSTDRPRPRPRSCEKKAEPKRSSCLKSPSSRYDCGEGRLSTGPSQSSARSRCISEDKYPCDESDDEAESSGKDSCGKKPKNDGCGPLFMSEIAPKQKKGLAAKLCPCFVKPKSRPSCIFNAKDSTVWDNDKCTQTSKDDFKIAMHCMKVEQKLERQRQKMYNRKAKKAEKFTCAEAKAMRDEGFDCPDDVDPAKREADYKKARDKYREKRKRLEDTINRAMEKERKRNLKLGC